MIFFCFVVGIIQHFFSELALVHICIPHTYTPCGRVIGLKVLPTLMGLSLWDCLALAFCVLIISQTLRFVKTFFNFFLGAVGDLNPHFNILPTLGGYSNLLARMCWRCDSNAHHPFADSTEDTSHRWENPTRTGGVAHRGTLRYRSTPSAFCTLIVSQLG